MEVLEWPLVSREFHQALKHSTVAENRVCLTLRPLLWSLHGCLTLRMCHMAHRLWPTSPRPIRCLRRRVLRLLRVPIVLQRSEPLKVWTRLRCCHLYKPQVSCFWCLWIFATKMVELCFGCVRSTNAQLPNPIHAFLKMNKLTVEVTNELLLLTSNLWFLLWGLKNPPCCQMQMQLGWWNSWVHYHESWDLIVLLISCCNLFLTHCAAIVSNKKCTITKCRMIRSLLSGTKFLVLNFFSYYTFSRWCLFGLMAHLLGTWGA